MDASGRNFLSRGASWPVPEPTVLEFRQVPQTALRAMMLPIKMNNRKSPDLLVMGLFADGTIELFCTCSRTKRSADGSCEAQRFVLASLADVDDRGRTIVMHGPVV